MLFGKGQWAILGLKPESRDKFAAFFANPKQLFEASQLAAAVRTITTKKFAAGINPYDWPRKDEIVLQNEQDAHNAIQDIGDYLALDEDMRKDSVFIPEDYAVGYGSEEKDYVLSSGRVLSGGTAQVYAFWLVFNDYDDVTDVASKKEAISYQKLGKPFKFAVKEDKKMVEQTVKAVTVPIRKQFPVIVDFQSDRVYIVNSNKDEILMVRDILEHMGAETYSIYWNFGGGTWVEKFLQKVYTDSHYKDEFKKRAEERSRFKATEIEPLEDKTLERVVKTFFAMSELPTGEWAGLAAPAKVKITTAGDLLSGGESTLVTTLLGLTNVGEVMSAKVVFQELTTKTRKEKEYTVRHDLFSIDLNDQINMFDAGAAMLRGFDLPRYKNEIKRMIKDKQDITITTYWYEWLVGMRGAIATFIDNVTEALELSGDEEYGLKRYESEGGDGATSIEEISVEGL